MTQFAGAFKTTKATKYSEVTSLSYRSRFVFFVAFS